MTSIPRRRSVLAATATAAALGAGLLAPATANAETAGATSAPRPAGGTSYDITLITGDVVHYTDLPGKNDIVTVDRAEGATGGVEVQTYGDQTYVLPSEAMGLLATDKLDKRLFNVTQLAKMGYDDAKSVGIPVIAVAPKAKSAKAPAAPKGAKAVRTLGSIDATALKADKKQARAFWQDVTAGAKTLDAGLGKIWLDGKVKASLAESVPQINAPQAWAKGYDGKGTKVAVLDTGVDPAHPDVKDRIAGTRSFVPGEEVTDGHGHGTHVASTVAGSGAAADGKYKGVAPGTDLLIGKVLADTGYGDESWIVAGMEWAKAQGADVVSMSLGGGPDDGDSPEAQAVNALSANGGPLFVIAAGNAGGEGTVATPGSARDALTVAAVSKTDVRASFSSMGPLTGSYALKPDISAPGVDIWAAASQAVPGWTGGMYRKMSGTSMATPHVAGAAAILKQRHPDWDGQRIKHALMSTSKQLAKYPPYAMGTGRLDVLNAVDTTIEATGSVDAAVYKWPHEGAAASERKITYRNTGSADVTLDLALSTQDAACSLSESTLTVPAGGAAVVTLTLDPTNVPVDSKFSGQVTATDAATGTVAAHTGFALYKERELYDVTFKLVGRDGKPASDTIGMTYEGADGPWLLDVDGERTLRVPPGNYTAWSSFEIPGSRADSRARVVLTSPENPVTGDTTITLDASKARRVATTTQRETENDQTILDFRRTYTSGAGFSGSVVLPLENDELYTSPTKPVTKGEFGLTTRWFQREKFLDAETGDGRNVELAGQVGTAFKDGVSSLKTVYAGKGAATDYAGLNARGKAVLVTRSTEVDALTRAKAATDASAAMLITVNDGQGRAFDSHTPKDGSSQSLTIASVMRLDGERLIAEAKSGRGTLNIRQKRFPDYQYDLARVYDGSVPDRTLDYSPAHEELAKVTNSFYGDKQAPGYGGRCFQSGRGSCTGYRGLESYPGVRTDYVTPPPAGGRWQETHAIRFAASGSSDLDEIDVDQRFQAGVNHSEHWFKPITAPRIGGSTWLPFRQQDNKLAFNIPMWAGSGAGHVGAMQKTTYSANKLAVYQGDTLLKTFNGSSGTVADVSPERLPYRLVATGTRDAKVWKTSVSTRTEWGFVSGAIPAGDSDPWQEDLDLLNLTYDISTDLAGDVRGGHRVDLGLGSVSWSGGVHATRAALQVSYDDGTTWQPATATKLADGKWAAAFTPPDTPGGFVSLRTTTESSDGHSVTQEVIRAFGLK
ncbi:S8 family serine peptidase [Streptomyces sp. TRM66268-LWL]|uniref:S8 family serine peptidase n=1 Tax=Streptomyces polyasparticus TaxID=2767826 RepID=A0ABR7SZ63_9ACTN|nr:S8 family serine peptidase [Streptomyces polyasparticus]MBC9719558.1 S8 family serine peptidase [Streptomyces polyasparticus]